ncbi:MAG: glycosyltransferase [Bacteroidota bacterium]|nr:glycosyltransferase [Bacteroidota bacterium]
MSINNDQLLVSIIVPVYNGERYLKDCISSILNQTYRNIEIIACEDCGSDKSNEILENFNYDSRFKYFKNSKNKGLFPTLNSLIHKSNGELIHLFAQDDILKPNAIEEIVEFYKLNKMQSLAFIMTRVDYIDEFNNLMPSYKEDATPKIISPALHAKISVFWGCLPGNISTVTLIRSIVQEFGGFNESYKVSGDFEYWYRITQSNNIGYVHNHNIMLRRHLGQLSRNFDSVYLSIIEDYPLIKGFQKRLMKNDKSKSYFFVEWRLKAIYLNDAIFLLRNRKWKLGFKTILFIGTISFLPFLFTKWIIIRILRLLKIEYALYNYVDGGRFFNNFFK